MLETIVLGLVQGLTEFLPVSSSGHLVLVHQLFGFSQIDPAFDVFVQGGTVLSVLIFFRSFYKKITPKYVLYLAIATIPAGVLGLLLKDYVDALFTSLWGVTLGFFLTTIIVWLSRFSKDLGAKITKKSALWTGFAQSVAILPGLTRSGTTITAALFQGIDPQDAFNFSFLLSIPTIAGASLLGARSISWDTGMSSAYFVGFLVAFISGYFSLSLLAKLMKKGQFHRFAPYTFALSLLSLYLALT